MPTHGPPGISPLLSSSGMARSLLYIYCKNFIIFWKMNSWEYKKKIIIFSRPSWIPRLYYQIILFVSIMFCSHSWWFAVI